MTPLVSVLMPAYNAEKYIGEAIESILNQTFTDFELIISDDLSIDKTWEVIQDYAKKDKRISIYKNKKNLYIAENRNVLVRKAKGKYIAWQDADDISLVDRIEKQYEFMEQNPRVGIIGGYLQFFDEKGIKSIRKYATTDSELRKNIFRFSPVAQPTAMIRSECFKKTGLYNPKYPPAEDIDMSFRIGSCFEFSNIPQITLKYREHFNSSTFKKLKKIELSTLEVRWQNSVNPKYKMGLIDYVYNVIQYLSIFIVPTKIKIELFNLIRNVKK
ncbi:MAG: glycosyltransferase family 2 protein [Minisyncoccia bacterium]